MFWAVAGCGCVRVWVRATGWGLGRVQDSGTTSWASPLRFSQGAGGPGLEPWLSQSWTQELWAGYPRASVSPKGETVSSSWSSVLWTSWEPCPYTPQG